MKRLTVKVYHNCNLDVFVFLKYLWYDCKFIWPNLGFAGNCEYLLNKSAQKTWNFSHFKIWARWCIIQQWVVNFVRIWKTKLALQGFSQVGKDLRKMFISWEAGPIFPLFVYFYDHFPPNTNISNESHYHKPFFFPAIIINKSWDIKPYNAAPDLIDPSYLS